VDEWALQQGGSLARTCRRKLGKCRIPAIFSLNISPCLSWGSLSAAYFFRSAACEKAAERQV
jgi:hypothetical protein